MLMNFFQIISIFNIFEFAQNEIDGSTNEIIRWLSGYAFSFFSFECLFQNQTEILTSTYFKALIYSILPFFLVLPILILFRNQKKKWKKLLITISITLFLIQPAILESLFNILKCTKISDDYYLSKDLSVLCYTRDYNQWVNFLVVPAFLFYIVGLPIVFIVKFLIYKKKDKIKKVALFTHGFQPKYFYFEYLLQWEKIFLITLAIFWEDINGKVFMATIFMALIKKIKEKFQPLLTRKLNDLELLRYQIQIMIILVKGLKIHVSHVAIDFLFSVSIILVQLIFFFFCLKLFIIIKIQAISASKVPKKFEKVWRKFSSIMTNEMFNEIKEYKGNTQDISQPAFKVPTLKKNKSENETNDNKTNEQLINALSNEIQNLGKIIKENKKTNMLTSPQKINESSRNLMSPKLSPDLLVNRGIISPNVVENINIQWPYFLKKKEIDEQDIRFIFIKEDFPTKNINIPDELNEKLKNIKINIFNPSKNQLINLKIKIATSYSTK